MSVQRRVSKYHSRTVVPQYLRPFVRRGEIVKTLNTSSHMEACNRAAQWEGHVAALFDGLRQSSARMTKEQIDALVAEYLDVELHEVEERLATCPPDLAPPNEWGYTQTDLEDEAVRESAVAVPAALVAKGHRETLPRARRLLPGADETTLAIQARRLSEARMQALDAELAGLRGSPLVRPKTTSVPPQDTIDIKYSLKISQLR